MNNLLLWGVTTLLLSLLVEVLLYSIPKFWTNKKYFGSLALILNTITLIFVFRYDLLSIVSIIFFISMLYRLFNILRLLHPRLNDQYLYNACSQTFAYIGFIQILLLGTLVILDLTKFQFSNPILSSAFIYILYFFVSSFMALLTTYNLSRTSNTLVSSIDDDKLPTVTLAIAARNENPALESCLISALADEYPKLEILVYDDESQDKTAEIIKQFAHDGVRFIKGSTIPEKWLAKNFAYQTLLEQASGQIVMFIGTDVHLHKDSIKKSVQLLNAKNIEMMSILPKRTKSGLVATFVQPMRYWWELAVPRLKANRPSTLSTAWVIKRESLIKIGGFKSYKRSIIPEEHLAKKFNKNGKYFFARSNKNLVITTHKNFHDQWETAIRLTYPQVHKRPEFVFAKTVFLFALLVPFILLALSLSNLANSSSVWSLLVVVLLLYTHVAISIFTNPISVWLAPLNFPLILFMDIIVINISMYRYEFSEVIWKDRKVRTKAMEVFPSLPKLD